MSWLHHTISFITNKLLLQNILFGLFYYSLVAFLYLGL